MGNERQLDKLGGKFTKLARVMSDRDVTIKLVGKACCTDGNTVYLPANSDVLDVDPHVLEGMADHEIWHVREDARHEKAGKTTSAQLVKRGTKPEKMMFNVYEDVRIEIAASREYVGVGENLIALNQHCIDKIRHALQKDETKENFWYHLGCVIIAKARGFDYSWAHKGILKALERLDEEIVDARNTKWAQGSRDLAIRTVRKVQELKDEIQKEQERRQQEQKEKEEQEQKEKEEQEQEKQKRQEEEEQKEEGKQQEGNQEEESTQSQPQDENENGNEAGKDDASDQGQGEPVSDLGDDNEDAENSRDEQDENGDSESEGQEGQEGDETANGEQTSQDQDENGNETDGNGTDGQGQDEPVPDFGCDEEDTENDNNGQNGEDGDGGDNGEQKQDGEVPTEDSRDSDSSNDNKASGTEDTEEGEDNQGQPSDATSELNAADADMSDSMGDDELDEVAKNLEDAEQEPDTDDIMDEVKEEIETAAEEDMEDEGRYTVSPEALAHDMWTTPNPGLDESYKELRQEVNSQIYTLKSKLYQLLKARTQARHVGDQESGALDSAALYSLRAGNKDVFSRKIQGEEIDTCVSILIDLSGSMGASSMRRCGAYYARYTAIALAETLNGLNIPFEIVGFNNGMRYGKRPWTRISSFRFTVFKAYSEKYNTSIGSRLVSINGSGQNADGEAVMEMAKRLIIRPEKRKILLVLSDGKPTASTNSNIGQQHLRDVISKVSKAGIEIYCVGMKCANVEEYYNKQHGSDCVVVYDMSRLAVEVMRLLKDKLTGQRRRKKVQDAN